MAQLVWDKTGERLYETGVEKCVLFKQNPEGTYGAGVAWNGVTNISEKPSGGETTSLWADNIKYANMTSVEELNGSIQAYMAPEEFAECDGSKELTPGVYAGQQNRVAFGLCYRTNIGNDVEGDGHGYKLHFIYGAKASPSERAFETINDSPNAQQLSWEFKTTPVDVTGGKPTSLVIIDSTKVSEAAMTAVEKLVYGGEGTSQLPTPDELVAAVKAAGLGA